MRAGMWLVRSCGSPPALRWMTTLPAVSPLTFVRRRSLMAGITAVLCAACTAGSGRSRVTPLAATLRPLSTRSPVPLLVWEYSPVESLGTSRNFMLAAYDDGLIIFRAPGGGGYRTVTDTALVRRLYGSAAERTAYAELRDVQMPPEWQVLDGAIESLCLWTGGAMRCHHLNNPWSEHIGRPDACAGLAHDTTSYDGRQRWTDCRQLNAAHATLPDPVTAYYRRAHDAVQEQASTAAAWTGPVFLEVTKTECMDGVRTQTPWPEDVPRPREGEKAGDVGPSGARRIMVTEEQAWRLREVDLADYRDCLVSDGSAWRWWAYFQLPNLGVKWVWNQKGPVTHLTSLCCDRRLHACGGRRLRIPHSHEARCAAARASTARKPARARSALPRRSAR
ncbi:hypothetical protein FHS01_000793 [Longimicrobium terrae]|uniref:Uncharacterized protein n=1 Tax=Longimicrobium terrae TaxID=1639882 RepID=A0A841GUQ1_9BACT|nr:hypothetical protein [Longimicrobium terrae]MBB6069178.1 hypothetical protein [Longimicrobium terrae]